MDYSKYKDLKIDKKDGILTITINRPDDLNAVSEDMHMDFSTIFIDAEFDDEVDIIILTGAGKAFCAGGDLKWLLRVHGDPLATSYTIAHDRKIQNMPTKHQHVFENIFFMILGSVGLPETSWKKVAKKTSKTNLQSPLWGGIC